MTDFEHKSGRGGSKQPSGGDPMLELTRLFGSRPRPISARVSYGGQSQDTSVFDAYNNGQGSLSFDQDTPQNQQEEWYEDSDSALAQYDANDGFVSSASNHETQWNDENWDTNPEWEDENINEAPPAHASSWQPAGFEEEASYDDSFQDEDPYHPAQRDEVMVAPAFVSSAAPAAEPSPAAPPPSPVQKPKLRPSAISNVSFGYGHSVQITPQTFANPVVSAPQMERPTPQDKVPSSSSPQVPAAAGRNPAPVGSGQGSLDEALHDFDLTIAHDKRRHRQPVSPVQRHSRPMIDPAVASVPLDSHHIEKTGNFDLPPVPYEAQGSGQNAPPHHLSPSLSHTVASREAVAPPPLPKVEPEQPVIYDWGAPKGAAALPEKKSKKANRLYGFMAVLLLFAMGAGAYLALEYYMREAGDPAIITADPDEIRIVPQQGEAAQPSTPETTVYGGENPSRESQGGLRDGRETPLNMDQIDEQPPFSNETSLEPRSIEDSILRVLSRAIPVHLVPTVVMRRDSEGNLVDVSQNNNAPAVVVRPGADYSAAVANARAMQAEGQEVAQTDQSSAQTPPMQTQQTGQTAGDIATPSLDDMQTIDAQDVQIERLPSGEGGQNTIETIAASFDDGTNRLERGGATAGGLVDVSSSSLIPANKPPVAVESRPVVPAQNNDVPPAQVENAPAEGNGDFYVQIASQPTQAAARQSADEAKQRFAAIIGDRRISIVPADIPGRGIYYRVRVATGERSAAVNLCEQYKQAGGSCFIGH